jgi:uncharacterized protein YndB with AHSA1/START domain
MPDILHRFQVKASPRAVYQAITEAGGLRSWWTTDAQAEPTAGSLAVFHFEGGQVQMRMRVQSLDPDRAVRWQVEEPSPPEWKGTTVTWDLTEREGGTEVLFGHRGWNSTEGSFPFINYSWGYYLLSLVKHLEEGKGFPHPQAA